MKQQNEEKNKTNQYDISDTENVRGKRDEYK